MIDFVGRTGDLGRLVAWRDGPDERAVRLLFGPGGQGKTRLATKLAEESVRADWTVAVARRKNDGVPPGRLLPAVTPVGSRSLLVLVDYADRCRSRMPWR